MSAIQYGDGTLYGQGIYGRISDALAQAQVTQVRQTGLQVSVIDERTNDWEFVNNVGDINPIDLRTQAGLNGGVDNDTRSPFYVFYKGFCHVVKLSGGNIIRIRVGSHTDYNDRQIYIQTITDPTDPAQWQAWSLLYSGTHFAAVIVPIGASTYNIYHTKSGVGLCKNNVVLWATATDGQDMGAGIRISVPLASTGPRHLTITVPKSYAYDGFRVLDLYVTTDADSVQPVASNHNFKWTRNTTMIAEDPLDPDYWLFFRSFQLHNNPRIIENGESLTVTRVPALNTQSLDTPPRIIRGMASQVGHHTINPTQGGIVKSSDGYLYMFYYEIHTNDGYEFITNTQFLFWQRSKDGIYWSDPVLVGFNIPAPHAGAIESGGYIYFCGNGSVIRRPIDSVEYVIDNYVPGLSFDLPRSNQEASGSVIVANPDNINSDLVPLSDRRIIILPGLRTEGGAYEYEQFSDFWIKQVTEETDSLTNRLTMSIGDIWSRLSEQMRDTFNIIGQTIWQDWGVVGQKELFNYFFEDGEGSVSGNSLVVTEGTCLWTGWKGHNLFFEFTWGTPAGDGITFYIRYIDENNHIRFVYSGSTLRVFNLIDGVTTEFATINVGSGVTRFGVLARWGEILVYADSVLKDTITPAENSDPYIWAGYVGWSHTSQYYIGNVNLSDWEHDVSSHDLIKFALAMGDYHDVIVGGPSNKEYALAWGPQTDIPTAAEALRSLLIANKLELIWKDGYIEVGQFKNIEPYRTIENEIIQHTFTDEAIRRINLAIVDGNEHSWLEADTTDSRERDRQIVGYFDLPELLDQEAVRARAQEEIRRGVMGQSPGGLVPLFFDLHRMDVVTWIDNHGTERVVRIEGIRVDINQSTTPSQRETLDTSLVE